MEARPRQLGVEDSLLKVIFKDIKRDIKINDFVFFSIVSKREGTTENQISDTNEKNTFEAWFRSLTIHERVLASSIVFKKSKDIRDGLFDLIDKSLNESFYSEETSYL